MRGTGSVAVRWGDGGGGEGDGPHWDALRQLQGQLLVQGAGGDGQASPAIATAAVDHARDQHGVGCRVGCERLDHARDLDVLVFLSAAGSLS